GYGYGYGGGSWNYIHGTPGSYEGRANVLLGNGDGSFSETPNAADLGYGSHTSGSVAVGDFNADGKLDLGVTSSALAGGSWGYWGNYYPGYSVGYANVVLGTGDGSFSAPTTPSLGYASHTSAAVPDFHG